MNGALLVVLVLLVAVVFTYALVAGSADDSTDDLTDMLDAALDRHPAGGWTTRRQLTEDERLWDRELS